MELKGATTKGVPSHERHFYSMNRAFGRLGMRVFEPTVMNLPHWHGHVEINLLTGSDMSYEFDGHDILVESGQPVIFWAGIPHQLQRLHSRSRKKSRLANLYFPVDGFLTLPHIAPLQVALLGGAMARLPARAISAEQMDQWYSDYRSGDVHRLEMLKMEVNTILRRALVDGISYLREPVVSKSQERSFTPSHIQHVVAMVRYVLENLSQPMVNADVTRITGLHENYALALFSRTMRVSLKRFIIQMRLIRARAALIESSLPITSVAAETGFTSISQFYAHFKESYGMSPHAMRIHYAGSR